MNVTDTGAGEGERTFLKHVLQGHDTIRPDIWVREMGPDSPDGTYPWGLPPQGGPSSDRAKALALRRRGVVLTTPGGDYAEGRLETIRT